MTERDSKVAKGFRSWRLRGRRFVCDGCGFRPPLHFKGARRLLHAHHIIPLKAGGEDAVHNLALLCLNCHSIAHLPMGDYVIVSARFGLLWVGPTDIESLRLLLRFAADPLDREARFEFTGDVSG